MLHPSFNSRPGCSLDPDCDRLYFTPKVAIPAIGIYAIVCRGDSRIASTEDWTGDSRIFGIEVIAGDSRIFGIEVIAGDSRIAATEVIAGDSGIVGIEVIAGDSGIVGTEVIPNPVVKSRFYLHPAQGGFVRIAPPFRVRVFIDL